jgi:hypothetical protein
MRDGNVVFIFDGHLTFPACQTDNYRRSFVNDVGAVVMLETMVTILSIEIGASILNPFRRYNDCLLGRNLVKGRPTFHSGSRVTALRLLSYDAVVNDYLAKILDDATPKRNFCVAR